MPARVERGFLLDLADKPGALHDVTARIADAGVNIAGIAGLALGGEARIALLTDNSLETRQILRQTGVGVRPAEFLVVTAHDEPGELDRYLTRLSDQGLNIVALFSIATPEPSLAFALDDAVKGREALRAL